MQDLDQRNKKTEQIILLVLGTLIALGPFSIDMYLPAFSSIAEDFSVSKVEVNYSLTSYFVGIALGQLSYGPVMDRFGRKKPLLIGIFIYILAAIGCYFSTNLWMLVIFRFFLAIGAAAGMVAAKAVVRDVFPVDEVARAISFLMLIMGGAPIIAPTVGGLVMTNFSWNTIFLLLAIFALLMFISVAKFLPESGVPDKSVDLKLKDITYRYIDIFKNKVFLTFSMAGSLTIGAMFAYISSANILFTSEFNMTEQEFGIFFGVNAAGLILGSQLNRLALKRLSTFRVSIKISVFLVGLAGILLLNIFTWNNFYITVGILFFILFLLGFQNPNTTALSLYPFEKEAGRASALVGSLKMMLGAVASFVISKFDGKTIYAMAITIFVCLVFSAFLLFRFQAKEKRALIKIGR